MRSRQPPRPGLLSGSGAAVLLATACAIAGCGRGGPAGAIWVTGAVMYDGKPLAEGGVHFLAKDGKASASGSARLEDGKFGLYLMPGDYSIAIVSTEGSEEMDMKTGRVIPAKSRIPLRYTTVTESGLVAQVDAAHRTVSLALESQ